MLKGYAGIGHQIIIQDHQGDALAITIQFDSEQRHQEVALPTGEKVIQPVAIVGIEYVDRGDVGIYMTSEELRKLGQTLVGLANAIDFAEATERTVVPKPSSTTTRSRRTPKRGGR